MINEKKVETYFSVLKDFTYNSIFSFIRLWIPRLIPFCGISSTAQLLALGIAQNALFNELNWKGQV